MKLTRLSTLLAALVFSTGIALAVDGVPATYPLTKCVISEETLGEHGKPVKVTHEGTDVYLCCKACLKDFKKDPATYVKQVKDAAAAAAKKK